MLQNSIYKSQKGKAHIQEYYNSLLKNWPQPSKQHYINTSLGTTFIIENGKATAPPLLLLHGSGSNMAMWMADVNLPVREYHVFAIDIIGECGKSEENRPPFEKDVYANWILEIMNDFLLGTISIVGCSLGGWIGLNFAITYPQKTDTLILTAAAGITPQKHPFCFGYL